MTQQTHIDTVLKQQTKYKDALTKWQKLDEQIENTCKISKIQKFMLYDKNIFTHKVMFALFIAIICFCVNINSIFVTKSGLICTIVDITPASNNEGLEIARAVCAALFAMLTYLLTIFIMDLSICHMIGDLNFMTMPKEHIAKLQDHIRRLDYIRVYGYKQYNYYGTQTDTYCNKYKFQFESTVDTDGKTTPEPVILTIDKEWVILDEENKQFYINTLEFANELSDDRSYYNNVVQQMNLYMMRFTKNRIEC